MSLPNSDINGFTETFSLMPGGKVPLQDPDSGVTYKFDLSTLLATQSGDFRWVSTHSYDEGNIVTYGGSLWESQDDDNEGNIPVDGSIFWLEVPKSVSLNWWKAGAFTEDKVAVVSDHRGTTRWYLLKNIARPYNSADIAAEEAAGDWEGVTDQPINVAVANGAMDIIVPLDCKFHKDVTFFVNTPLLTTFDFTLVNAANLQRLVIVFGIGDDSIAIFLPANFKVSDANWNPGAHAWGMGAGSGVDNGRCLLEAIRCGTDFYVTKIITQLV